MKEEFDTNMVDFLSGDLDNEEIVASESYIEEEVSDFFDGEDDIGEDVSIDKHPQVIDPGAPFTPPAVSLVQVDGNSSLQEVVDADAQTSFLVLHMLHQAWGKVTDINEVASLAKVTMSTLETRRKLLNKIYGAPYSKQESGKISSID